MTHTRAAGWGVLFAATCALGVTRLGRTASAAPVTGEVRAGRDARLACTLDEIPLAGYGGGDRRKSWPATVGHTFFFRPSEGVADPVRVKSVVIEIAGQRMAFVSLDAVGAPINLIDAVVAELGGTGLDRDNLVFAGTHTHSGPGALSDRVFWQIVAVDILDPQVFDHVKGNVVASIQAAVADLQPARLGTGVADVPGISANRRHEGAPVNTELGVIKIENPEGEPLAAIFNFAVHGTCLGASNLLLSADNMGYAERYLETMLPDAVALFVNGAEADVKPIANGFDGAQAVGEALGAAVESVWQTTETAGSTTLEIQSAVTSLPELQVNATTCDDTVDALLDAWLVGLPGDTAETEEQFMAIRLGESAWITVPGEPLTEIGAQIAAPVRAMGFEHAFILGLTNGYMGYVVTPEEYDLGGYETCGCLYGRDTGVFVVEHALAVAAGLAPPSAAATDAGPTSPPDAASPSTADAGSGPDTGGATGADGGSPGADGGEQGCACEASGRHSAPILLVLAVFVLGVCSAPRRLFRR